MRSTYAEHYTVACTYLDTTEHDANARRSIIVSKDREKGCVGITVYKHILVDCTLHTATPVIPYCVPAICRCTCRSSNTCLHGVCMCARCLATILKFETTEPQRARAVRLSISWSIRHGTHADTERQSVRGREIWRERHVAKERYIDTYRRRYIKLTERYREWQRWRFFGISLNLSANVTQLFLFLFHSLSLSFTLTIPLALFLSFNLFRHTCTFTFLSSAKYFSQLSLINQPQQARQPPASRAHICSIRLVSMSYHLALMLSLSLSCSRCSR